MRTLLAVFATLTFSAACATESARQTELAPLPAPKSGDLRAPGGICEKEFLTQDALFDVTVKFLGNEARGQSVRGENNVHIIDYAGSVEALEDPVSAEIEEELSRQRPQRELRAAVLNVDGKTLRLVTSIRSLGLREGMHFEARETYRVVGGFGEGPQSLTFRSSGEPVLYHERNEFPEDLSPPEGLKIERAEVLCYQSFIGGDLYSMRISNEAGQSIVLHPLQAGSLGDYDIYLWVAIYPAGTATVLRALDAPAAITALTIVRRVFHSPNVKE